MRKNGRPAFNPTDAHRRLVVLLVAARMSEREIASVLEVDERTLRKYFADELQNGRARKIAENLLRLDDAAADGNVTAQKYLDLRLSGETAAPLGKKEQAAIEAETAHEGTQWAGLIERFDRLN